jgi:L-ascorbate metabolism protein UlaG (beta-lactamase superfamily)
MVRLAAALVSTLLAFLPARAEEACLPGMAELGGARIIRAGANMRDGLPGAVQHRAAVEAGNVEITYIGHSTFVIESPKGVTMATDYNDYVKPKAPPVIATMNRAHDTHYTRFPDPAIKHVLRGWGEGKGRAIHDIAEQDVRVRNVPTNIRAGEDTNFYGNSIFIFEVSGLCIGHLGHLHHTLAPEHMKAIGQLDVVLIPVDGSYTLDPEGMREVIAQLQAPLMIPMHYFGQSTLNRFLDGVRDRYEVVRKETTTITLSRATLPTKPTVMVLPGRHF